MTVLIAKLKDLLEASEGRPLKLAVARRLPWEREWKGVWSFGEVINSRYFEMGFASPKTPQEFHAHETVYEIYVFLGRAEIEYLEGNSIEKVSLDPGDVVIFPPKVFHKVSVIEKGAYVISVCAVTPCKLGRDKVKIPQNSQL